MSPFIRTFRLWISCNPSVSRVEIHWKILIYFKFSYLCSQWNILHWLHALCFGTLSCDICLYNLKQIFYCSRKLWRENWSLHKAHNSGTKYSNLYFRRKYIHSIYADIHVYMCMCARLQIYNNLLRNGEHKITRLRVKYELIV